MSSLYLKGVRLIDPASVFHKQTIHLFAKNGRVEYLGYEPIEVSQGPVLEGSHLVVTPGWFDLRANFCDPGLEHREDIESGLNAAKAGGFTDVMVLPDTKPALEAKNDMEYLKARAAGKITTLHPTAAVTRGRKGEELTEMIDLYQAGAEAFTDGNEPVWNTDILLKTLQYLQPLNALLINRAEDKWLSKFGVMHEGLQSTMLGMRGVPAAAETMMLERDLQVLRYAGGRLHVALVSSAETVELIRKAKKKGLAITCDVAAHQLYFNDSQLQGFDANYKVSPPLRTEKDRKALIAGVKDGVIDAIVSAHEPVDEEGKNLEFDLADFGMIGLQTVWPILNSLASKEELPLEHSLPALFSGPRRCLAFHPVPLQQGDKACLTVADTAATWHLDAKTNRSKSHNSPFWGRELSGRVAAVVNNGMTYLVKK